MTTDIRHTCPRLEESYTEIRHPSGLRILVSYKDFSAAYGILGVHYGSRDRLCGGAHPMGIAHFLEHKMFEKSDGTSWEDDFSALGAEVNAYTSDDCTAYLFSATDHIPEAIEALLRMVNSLEITPASVARERSIIAEEIRMNTDDPWESCYAAMLRGLYPPVRKGGNPVREEICGSEASIRRITPAVLRAAHTRFYHPANMVLAVSGRVSTEEVRAAVDRVLCDKPAEFSLTASRRRISAFPTAYKAYTEARMDTAKPLFSIGIKHPAPPTEPMALLRLERLMTLLSEMLFSRSGDFYSDLFERSVISPGISYGSSVGRPALGGTGEGYAYLYLSGEGDDPRAVFAALEDYIAAVKREGLDPAAFERARRTMYADYICGFDSTEGIASSLMTTAMDGIGLYDLSDVDATLTLAEAKELLDTLFAPSQYTLSVVLPAE